MSSLRTITRYYLVINMVKRPGFPSLEDIIHRLEDHDFFISARTLQRDFAKINADFGIDIQYNYYHKGYYVEEADSKEYNSVMKFLELSVMAGTFNELATDRKSLRELVSFDSEDQVRGVEYIPGILFAIKNRRLITIKYQKFSDSAPYERKVKPGSPGWMTASCITSSPRGSGRGCRLP